jgi:hypothetical protein
MTLLYMSLIAFFNVARGRKLFGLSNSTVLSRIIFALGTAFLSQMFLGASIWLAFVIFVGLMLWSSFGWGKYFSAFTGIDDPNEKEIKWIDDIGYSVIIGIDEFSNLKRGLLCMCLRGLYMYPMFALLGLANPLAFIVGIGCILQGVPYFAAYYFRQFSNPVIYAEAVWGACIAIMLVGAL